MRLLLLALVLAPLASAQPVRVDLVPFSLQTADGYARTRPEADGRAALQWDGREDAVEIVVTAESIIYAGAPSPLVALDDRISASRFDVDGLGTVEVRRFADSPYVLYALVDARRGTVTVGDRVVDVRLSRVSQTAGFDRRARLGLDLDGDGAFVAKSVASGDSVLVRREDAPAYRARRVGTATLVVDSVAADGTALWIRETADETGIEPGLMAPDAALVRLSGDSLRVVSLRGKTVVLSWWATTCPYCAQERPLLNETAAAYAGSDDVVWLAVAMDSREDVAGYLPDHPYAPEVVLTTPEAEEVLEGVVFPRHTVLDPSGRVVFDESGIREGRDADLRAAIAAARAAD